jgi:hypothetical protein
MILCEYGCNQEAKFILKNGKQCCSNHYQSCPNLRKKNSESHSGDKHPRGFLGKIPWNKGKTLEESVGIEKSIEIKNKLREASKGRSGYASTPEKELERRRKISLGKKGNRGGYRRESSRGKSGWYRGYWCDSSYELAYVMYNLDYNIEFERNYTKFPYSFEGKIHNWLPDFIVGDKYVEIKGYLNEKDKNKIEQFKEPLILLINEGIKPYIDYAKEKYGKNYVELYDNVNERNTKNKILKKSKLCLKCGKPAYNKYCSGECYNMSRQKVVRPSKKELVNILKNNSFVSAGKQFGVSDNAIRKWCKRYEINIKDLFL